MNELFQRAKQKQQARYNRCKVGAFYREHPELEDQTREALDLAVEAKYIYEILVEDHGRFAPEDSFKRHMRGLCSCGGDDE